MRDGFKKIHHPELNAESAVPAHTVKHWQTKGWKDGGLPASKPATTTTTPTETKGS